ncbi:MAG: DinB family protein [Acidobacteria bacterium]|nr:DinB family protein [Acidobacteriota bacterium]
MDQKAVLHRYLSDRRTSLERKLQGLSEYQIRQPLTPTGTNLLGLVKHVGFVQLGYLGEVFGRPSARDHWIDDSDPDADMFATAEESRAQILDFYHFSATHADATVQALDLSATGVVPWWAEEQRNVTLGHILVHVNVEVAHHLGHADILRELLDGALGSGQEDPDVPKRTTEEWSTFRNRVEAAAQGASS